MRASFRKSSGIVCHAVPSLMAIGLLEFVNIQVYIYGPVSKGAFLLLGWLLLQMVPGFTFGYISDRHFRKKALVISQILGLVGGIALYTFGYEIWVLVFIALVFNPMPVARAAFLDNYPDYSILKILGVTFLAQYLPWVFFGYFAQIPEKYLVVWTLALILVNIVLTIVFFKDGYDKKKRDSSNDHFANFIKISKSPVLLILVAFTLAEATFYLLWTYLEVDPQLKSQQSSITIGTIVGIVIAMLYNRLPHISIISLFYSIGAATVLCVLLRCLVWPQSSCVNDFVRGMNFYSVIGGMYLPFVAVAIIGLFGSEHRALGSATIEFSDTIAVFAGPLTSAMIHDKTMSVVIITLFLYLSAAVIQGFSEKKLSKFKL